MQEGTDEKDVDPFNRLEIFAELFFLTNIQAFIWQ
jgi:hypothetical protein